MKLLLHSVCKMEKNEGETNTTSVCKPQSYMYINCPGGMGERIGRA